MKAILLSTLLSFGASNEQVPVPPTPAQLAIKQTLAGIASHPAASRNYNQLAMDLAKRGRETADPEFYERGHQALSVSEALDPENFGARRTRAWLYLGEHRFREALELATKLNQEVPDDVLIYGFLVDAHVELGNYAAAEEACQWMLDLRPGNVPGLTRASYLRQLFGDVEGALELMAQAYHGIHPSQREDLSWVLTHMAQLHRSVGRNEVATTLLKRALELFPEYHYALAELAQVHMALGEFDAAAEVFERRYKVASHPENLLELAEALQAAGEDERATQLMGEFEAGALAESGNLDNANRELALYLVDHCEGRAEEALRIARIERERRQDAYTQEVYAWALLANDRVQEAQQEIEQALSLGQRSARLFLHAGVILQRAGQPEQAAKHLRACLELEPGPQLTVRAEALLEQL